MSKDSDYSVGDFCYIVDSDNKIKLCEIKQIYTNEKELAYLVQDQLNFRFSVVPHRLCADDEKSLKGVKRDEPIYKKSSKQKQKKR